MSEDELISLKEEASDFITEDDSSWDMTYYTVIELKSREYEWNYLLMDAVKDRLLSVKEEIKEIKSIIAKEEEEVAEAERSEEEVFFDGDESNQDELESLVELQSLCIKHLSMGPCGDDETSTQELADEIGFYEDQEDYGVEFDSVIDTFSNSKDLKKKYPEVDSYFVKIPPVKNALEPIIFIMYKNDFLFYFNTMTDEITQANK
jgi:hypothetical protein